MQRAENQLRILSRQLEHIDEYLKSHKPNKTKKDFEKILV